MPLLADRAICLRKFEYSETSQILSLLGREHGIARVIAKGAHRRTKVGASKFGGGVDLLELGQALYIHDPRNELGTLTEWTLLEGHLGLRRDLRGMYLGLYAAELLTMLIEEHDPHPLLFDRLDQLLGELPSPRREEAFLSFEMDLLREAGFAPRLDECCQCGRELDRDEPCSVSVSRGGVVCRACEDLIPDHAFIDSRLLNLLRAIRNPPGSSEAGAGAGARLPQLTRRQSDPLNRLLAAHIRHITGRRTRLANFVLASESRRA